MASFFGLFSRKNDREDPSQATPNPLSISGGERECSGAGMEHLLNAVSSEIASPVFAQRGATNNARVGLAIDSLQNSQDVALNDSVGENKRLFRQELSESAGNDGNNENVDQNNIVPAMPRNVAKK